MCTLPLVKLSKPKRGYAAQITFSSLASYSVSSDSEFWGPSSKMLKFFCPPWYEMDKWSFFVCRGEERLRLHRDWFWVRQDKIIPLLSDLDNFFVFLFLENWLESDIGLGLEEEWHYIGDVSF